MIKLAGNFGGKPVAIVPRACAVVTLLPTQDKLGQARTSYQNRPIENGASTWVERMRRIRIRIVRCRALPRVLDRKSVV